MRWHRRGSGPRGRELLGPGRSRRRGLEGSWARGLVGSRGGGCAQCDPVAPPSWRGVSPRAVGGRVGALSRRQTGGPGAARAGPFHASWGGAQGSGPGAAGVGRGAPARTMASTISAPVGIRAAGTGSGIARDRIRPPAGARAGGLPVGTDARRSRRLLRVMAHHDGAGRLVGVGGRVYGDGKVNGDGTGWTRAGPGPRGAGTGTSAGTVPSDGASTRGAGRGTLDEVARRFRRYEAMAALQREHRQPAL